MVVSPDEMALERESRYLLKSLVELVELVLLVAVVPSRFLFVWEMMSDSTVEALLVSPDCRSLASEASAFCSGLAGLDAPEIPPPPPSLGGAGGGLAVRKSWSEESAVAAPAVSPEVIELWMDFK